ncbi:MAG: MBL fold metallo-hydrolase [Clostridia bacterium]|nr:MBL fold metallo-hydrolase [Clostridia bacterium]
MSRRRVVTSVAKSMTRAGEHLSKNPTTTRYTRIILLILVVLCLVAVIVVACANRPPVGNSDNALTIHFIDVGQGDSIFIQFPNGQTMLIDGAKQSTVTATELTDYLLNLYPNESVDIDYCMLTHTDADHCGSLDDVINHNNINVKCVYQPRVVSAYQYDMLHDAVDTGKCNYSYLPYIDTNVYASFVNAVHNEMLSGVCTHVEYNLQGQTINGEGWSMHIYNPSEQIYRDLATGTQTASEKNNVSPIMVLSCNGRTVLFTGDADEDAENNFLSNVNYNFGDNYVWSGDCDVLKVGHHGGEQSSNTPFLQVVKPEYSIISVGDNTYGHPTAQTLDRLGDYCGDNIYTTQECGNIVLTILAGEMNWRMERNVVSAYLPRQYQLTVLSYIVCIGYVQSTIANDDVTRQLRLQAILTYQRLSND